MKKQIMVVGLMLALLSLGVVQAKEYEPSEGYRQVIHTWVEERDQAVQEIVFGYMRNAKPESLKDAYARLVVMDTKLANDNVPLYITSLSNAYDLKACIRDVVRTYLKRQGVNFKAADFFEGQRFEMVRR